MPITNGPMPGDWPARLAADSPFQSFWMGGYEGADHINADGLPLDMARRTGHLQRLDEDYGRAAALGLKTVRESIGWRLAEPQPKRFDFTRLRLIAETARRHGIQVVWTLMHYGTPADVSLLDDRMIDRFARFARAVAQTLKALSPQLPVYNLINEIGFLAWAASATPQIHPYRSDLLGAFANRVATESTESSGYDVKRRLARAVIAAIDAVTAIEPRARFLHVEPVVHVTAPPDRPDLLPLAARVCSYQWQAWDLIGGRVEPGLGGTAEALDLIGVNYYHSGQWEVKTENRLWWHLRDPRRRPLSALLADTWQRYRRPLVIAETGHIGAGRAAWLHDVATEVEKARGRGVPVGGICLYPLIDRPDWNDDTHWHHSGLWNVGTGRDTPTPPEAAVVDHVSSAEVKPSPGTASPAALGREPADAAGTRRLLHVEYAEAIAAWQRRLPAGSQAAAKRPCLVAHSNRRWSAMPGRLQQLMTQLSSHYRVIVIEEPLAIAAGSDPSLLGDRPRLDRIPQGPGIEVLVPRIPVGSTVAMDADGCWRIAGSLLDAFLDAERIAAVDLWLTSPSAVQLLTGLHIRSVTYDCNDDWGRGYEASPRRAWKETAVLEAADLVLTGTPGLYDRLIQRHGNVHWLPDAVDAERFGAAPIAQDTEEAASARRLHERIGTPRLGFFGAIDGRLDLQLIRAVAERHPEWQLVMVGALEGVEPDALPRRANIHWLGLQPYGRLPHLMAEWDACLLPYGLTAANRFLCPPQVLQCLAAQKPIVATALPEVERLFGAWLRLAPTAESFMQECETALSEAPATPLGRASGAGAPLSTVSWPRSAERVRRLLELNASLASTTPARPSTGSFAAPVAAERRGSSRSFGASRLQG